MATPVLIDEHMSARIQRLATLRKRSPDSIVGEAIAEYVAREEDREDFIREAQASWEKYQETGLHLDAREVNAWLASWGTDGEHAAPECHE
ncbi:MAG: CopG family transcriptional regulator [Burkholderia sp.]|jgi:predicted transcriptional regulator|nr:CopG family transcriptional regulator [Burkholderia sp.]